MKIYKLRFGVFAKGKRMTFEGKYENQQHSRRNEMTKRKYKERSMIRVECARMKCKDKKTSLPH